MVDLPPPLWREERDPATSRFTGGLEARAGWRKAANSAGRLKGRSPQRYANQLRRLCGRAQVQMLQASARHCRSNEYRRHAVVADCDGGDLDLSKNHRKRPQKLALAESGIFHSQDVPQSRLREGQGVRPGTGQGKQFPDRNILNRPEGPRHEHSDVPKSLRDT